MTGPVDIDASREASRLQRQAANPAASAWVSASAGAGKTRVLTDRVLRLLLAGAAPARLLCLTFTKAAAAEMANRLGQRLSQWATIADEPLEREIQDLTGVIPEPAGLAAARRLFARVLDAPGGMKIMTIHAFCQSILGRFPVEAGVPPQFDVMDERTSAAARAEAIEAVLVDARRGADPRLAAALAQAVAVGGEDRFQAVLRALVADRARFRALVAGENGLDRFADRLAARLGVQVSDTTEGLLAEAVADRAFDAATLRVVSGQLQQSDTVNNQKRGRLLADWLAADADGRIEAFDAYRSVYFTNEGDVRKEICSKKFATAFPAYAEALTVEAARLVALQARLDAASALHRTLAFVRLADAVERGYERHKERHVLLDYDDLILRTRALLERPGIAPWVLFKLDGGLDHVLVDEAQDTNPQQWAILAALVDEFFVGRGAGRPDRTIFAVGDTKQSIYRFQGADPDGFRRMHDHFARRVQDGTEGVGEATWNSVALDISFRSTAAVLQAVDAVFAGPAAADGVTPVPGSVRHWPARVGAAGLVELWPPVVPPDEAAPAPWALPIRQIDARAARTALAEGIAETIRRWLAAGEMLPARGRAMRAGDVMVLVRRRSGFVSDLVRALKGRGVPVAGVDRMDLTNQLAVEDLIALGEFLLLPDDDLTLAVVLKGPLFGLDEDALFELAHRRPGRLWDALRAAAAERPRVAAAYEELSRLLARADFVPPHELFADVLAARGGRRAVLARLGPEAADPLEEFLSLALRYEGENVPSLQGFLTWLRSGSIEVKRDLDAAGRDEVRILTVHGAKGLEAPVVILPDTMQVPTQRDPIAWTADGMPIFCPRQGEAPPAARAARQAAADLDRQEYNRLLYVAMTRAEDRLYVCGWAGKRTPPLGNWYELVSAGLGGIARPFDPAGHAPFEAMQLAGSWLRHENAQDGPPRGERSSPMAAVASAPPPDWISRPPAAEPAPPRPLAPSQPAGPEPPSRSPLAGETGRDERLFRRGLLIHRLLQALPDLPKDRRADAAHRFLARPVHDLGADEQAAMAAETLAVLADARFTELFGPRSQAEVPVVGLVDGYALSGQIDRLVVTDQEVLIVDYKTLRPPPAREEDVPAAYLRQLALYARALAAIYPDRPVRAALLWTDGPRLMPISPALLATGAP